MANDLVERLKKLAHQQADIGGDPSYHGKLMLTHEDTMYWAAAARIEELEKALKPFAQAFEIARLNYSKRYQDRELGLKNLDKMPDDWPMEKLLFNMGTFSAAARAYKGE